MTTSSPKVIRLSMPKSWNELPTKQLELIMQFGIERDILSQRIGKLADYHYRLKVLQILLGLRKKVEMYTADNGQDYMIFQRKSWWPWSEKVPISMGQMLTIIDKIKWIDNPMTRIKAPYDFVHAMGRKFKCPTSKMTSVTYQQYTMAQNLVTAYWQTQENIFYLLEKKAKKKAIVFQTKKLQKLRCMFLACLFNPGRIEKEVEKGGRKYKSSHRSWEFDDIQIERNWKRFRFAQKKLFPVMLQFFLSTQQYFSSIFPDLFVTRETGKTKLPDFLLQEVETMTAIMKYQGFKDYQTIYDSNAVHVLKVLDNMAKDAKEIKKQQAKLKSK